MSFNTEMKLLRSKETVLPVILITALGLAASAVCLVFDLRAALVCAVLTIAVLIVHIVSTAKRYRRFRELSEDIDCLLAGMENADLAEYSEGELSILENQLMKLSKRILEQEAALRADKQMLADSIADISHQIKTPLTTMNLIVSALREQGTDEAKRAELLIELRRQLARIEWLVSSLLKLARLDANAVTFQKTQVSLEKLVEDSLAPLAIQLEIREQTVEMTCSGSAQCDPSWTAEALTNIIKNCSEHMGEGKLFIDASANPLYSEIVIRDSGKGIDPADLPHLFERFYRGKNADSTGVGIGLALCRRIIAGQNGTVKAENAKNGGAQFTVRLYKSAV